MKIEIANRQRRFVGFAFEENRQSVIATKRIFAVSRLLLFALVLILSPFAAHGATITVTNGNDDGDGSLRKSVNNAASGDTINFAPSVKTVTLTSYDIGVGKNLTIDGGLSGVTVARSGADGTYEFNIFSIGGGSGTGTVTVTLNRLTISNGYYPFGGGGVTISFSSTCNITNSTISGNTSESNGGAIYASSGTTVNIFNSTLSRNRASTTSGTIYLSSGATANVTNSTISGNSSGNGGGIFINYANSTLNLTNTTITNNHSTAVGGGIRRIGGTVTLKNSIVAENFRDVSPTPVSDDINGAMSGNSSYNLIKNCVSCGLSTGFNNNLIGAALNVKLAPLSGNGNLTQNHLPASDSPAVNYIPDGTNGCGTGSLNQDQRSVARPFNGKCDAGAVEIGLLIMTANSLPPVYAGQPFNNSITASGGTAPYIFSFVSGNLPEGLTLNSDGTISGTPTMPGIYNFAVQVQESTPLAEIGEGYENYDSFAPLAPGISQKDFQIQILQPTAATTGISGRVMTSNGTGISNIRLTLIDQSGRQHNVFTDLDGFYQFDALEVGNIYILTATAKHFLFAQPTQVVNLQDNLVDMNFTAIPVKVRTRNVMR